MNPQLSTSCFAFAFVFYWTSRFLTTEEYFDDLIIMQHWFLILHFSHSNSSSLDPRILLDIQPPKFMCRKTILLISGNKALQWRKHQTKYHSAPTSPYIYSLSLILCVFIFHFFPLSCPLWEVLSTRLPRALPNYCFTFSIFWPLITTLRERCDCLPVISSLVLYDPGTRTCKCLGMERKKRGKKGGEEERKYNFSSDKKWS